MTTPPDRPADITPEDKDWTHVVTAGCAECGFSPELSVADVGARLRATVSVWQTRLAAPDATERPAPQVWSPTEYACHVRDVCRLFRERLALMVATDGARFANWDQDATAVEARYWAQDPTVVAREYAEQAAATAEAFDAVAPQVWQHRGVRSNGSVFTIATFAPYFMHDIEHHVWDVTHP
jgi:hypothetical protein